MRALYRGAIAVTVASYHETFGMPMLEAMACGTPVVASQASSLPEIGGDAALYAPPDDAAAWAQALQRVTEDAAAARSFTDRGLDRATHFDWDESAAAHLAALSRRRSAPRGEMLVLCERVDAEGGTETYLRTLLPALAARGHTIRVSRAVLAQPDAYGVPAETMRWSDEHDRPSTEAARPVSARALAFAPDVAAVHNVLDAGVLEAIRRHAPRVAFHLHDHRPFCPNGDRLYPRGGGICGVQWAREAAAGTRCQRLRLRPASAHAWIDPIARSRRASGCRTADATIAFSHYVAGLAQRNGVALERMHVLTPPLDDDAFADDVATPPPANACSLQVACPESKVRDRWFARSRR